MARSSLNLLARRAREAQNALERTARAKLKPGKVVWAWTWNGKIVKARVEDFWGKGFVSLVMVSRPSVHLDRHTLAQLLRLNPSL